MTCVTCDMTHEMTHCVVTNPYTLRCSLYKYSLETTAETTAALIQIMLHYATRCLIGYGVIVIATLLYCSETHPSCESSLMHSWESQWISRPSWGPSVCRCPSHRFYRSRIIYPEELSHTANSPNFTRYRVWHLYPTSGGISLTYRMKTVKLNFKI